MNSLYSQLEQIVVNVGVGRLSSLPNFPEKILPEVLKEVSLITGQKPTERPAKQSVAGFKVRAGTVIGLKVTLRGKRMNHFLERLVRIVLPRVRDFRGIDMKSIDREGNLTIGLKEQVVFPEIQPELSKFSFGLEITIVPKFVHTKDKAIELYRLLGVPFKKHDTK